MNIKKLDRNQTTLSIAGFHEQNQLAKFNFNPPYQRKSIWSDEKQSYFIDSLLRNFPIPPIFLHRKIDTETGKTTFDVIDGKQRLTAIARFINNEIPAANEYGPPDAATGLDGLYFKDLSTNQALTDVRAAFWKYDLPVEYIDPTDVDLIEDVFDRLNRNGEALKGQELRNAQYHSTALMKAVDELALQPYLAERLKVTDLARMEDKEFCSECLLSAAEERVIGSSQEILDELYERHKDDDFANALGIAVELCEGLATLGLDYTGNRISGVSHLYGLWGLSLVLRLNMKSVTDYSQRLNEFYDHLRDPEANNDPVHEEYKKSMTSRTKERFMRVRRVNALLAACGVPELTIE